ncbi:MAG TPA: cytochrome c biogenesis protein CcsA [Nitrospiria bacterium]|nr:cytochrome c biogenesis protein CcsA [Nitrospiria bacterium]
MNALIKWMQRYEGWFGAVGTACIIVGLYLALAGSPPDYYQGEVVRIMYIHVPLVQTAMLAYSVLFGGSIWYLWKRDPIVDNMCQAAAGISAFLTAGGLITGSIWAKPTWNTWWTWDARLVSFAVMLMILVGYLMLRTFVDDPEREARYAAVLAIVGFVDLPIVHFSVEWWRTLHQPLSISMRGIAMTWEMGRPLMVMSAGFGILFVYILMVRTQMYYLTHLLLAKKGRLLSHAHLSDLPT